MDIKILPKSLAENLKHVLPELISLIPAPPELISESSRLISDIISDYLISDDFLEFQKNFFGENLSYWIKVLLNDQQSCVINGGLAAPYFNLEKGAR